MYYNKTSMYDPRTCFYLKKKLYLDIEVVIIAIHTMFQEFTGFSVRNV